jgi:hypothetical protein
MWKVVVMVPTGKCSKCGKLLGFAHTPSGKRMPLDPDPVAEGNVYVVDGPYPRCVVKSKQIPTPEGVPHLSHFVTCPAAAQFRRR